MPPGKAHHCLNKLPQTQTWLRNDTYHTPDTTQPVYLRMLAFLCSRIISSRETLPALIRVLQPT